MRRHKPAGLHLVFVCLGLGCRLAAAAPAAPAPVAAQPKETRMSAQATGTFEVKLTPQVADPAEPAVGRMTIDKTFTGDIDGTSKGQMLTLLTDVKDSAGYVAIERVSGKLHGRAGSFALQHSGLMTRGTPQLSITVVPDSGTGELTGLTGNLSITITAGKHFYTFDYALPRP